MSMLDDIVSKVTDSYERKARLYPALLALLPLFVTITLLYGEEAVSLKGSVTIAISCGGLYLLTNLCREQGKRLEEGLYREWGGRPSTQLLRHRDDTIECPTKHRYHAFLARKTSQAFPDKQQENDNPGQADGIYHSGVRWLLNHTRPEDGKKFDMLLSENTAYGFRRNALGIKPLGLAIAIATMLWVLARGQVIQLAPPFVHGIAFSRLPDAAIVSVAFSALMTFVWIFFFTKASVRTAAFTYAEALLRACDVL